MRLKNKVAFITGGSGIGEAAAELMAREGAKVAVLSRTMDDVERVAKGIDLSGHNVLPVAADVSRTEDVAQAVDKLICKWKRLDVLLANAGINGVLALIEELTPEEWTETLAVDLTGTFLTVKYSVPHLKKRGGSITIDSSVNGTRMLSNIGASVYATSRAG